MHLRNLFLGSAVLFAALPMMADTTYSYVGNPFTYTSDAINDPLTNSVSGSFTVSTALAANLNDVSVTAEAFSFTDGTQTIADGSPMSEGDFTDVSTDSNGNIIQWHFTVFAYGNSAIEPPTMWGRWRVEVSRPSVRDPT